MLDLIKDYVSVNNIALLENKSVMYEFDCIVPDVMPDMQKVLAVNAYAENDSLNIVNGNATIALKLNCKILYLTDEDKNIKSFLSSSEHSIKVSAETIKEDDILKYYCHVENIETEYINSRKISVKATVRTEILQKSTSQIAVGVDIAGLSDIQTQKNCIDFCSIVDNIYADFDVSEDIVLSNAKAPYGEILRCDAMLSDISSVLLGDKLQIKGNIILCTFYIADDISQSVQIIENEVPFTQSFEVEKIGEDITWHVDCFLNSYKAEAIADLDGEMRILRIVANIKVNADAFSSCQLECINDAYSLSQYFSLNYAPVECILSLDDINGQFVIRDSAVKPNDLPEISQIVNVTAVPGEYSYVIEKDKINVEGYIFCNILYLSDSADCPIAAFTSKIPFNHVFDSVEFQNSDNVIISACVNHISFNIMSPSETELRISVILKGCVIKTCMFNNVIGIEEPEDAAIDLCKDRPAILLYVVQPNDSVWKIAKRYNAPIELLKEINQLKNPDLIYPGQKILIPC